jgi:hypothetical protein
MDFAYVFAKNDASCCPIIGETTNYQRYVPPLRLAT